MQQRAQVGKIGCLCCGEEIPVKSSASGTISVSCPWCDFSGYAKAGTEAARLIGPRIQRSAKPEEKPAEGKAPAEKPAAKPVEKAPNKKPAVKAPTLTGAFPWEAQQ